MAMTRREFLVTTTGAATGLALVPGTRAAPSVILFQGDSITDCARDRTDPAPNHAAALGTGYPLLVAAALLDRHPERGLRFFNRGISGNRVPDLESRWQPDALDLRPDVLSVLIGVNDLWHKLMGRSSGTVAEYEEGYAALLARTRAALPAVRLVVLEPFVLRCGAVTEAWFPEFDERRAAATRVARQARATFIPLHGLFERLSRRAGPEYWAADGVHPTPAGHAAIARLWREHVDL